MAAKTWYLTNSILDSVHQEMSETAPGTANSSPAIGWVVGNTIIGTSPPGDTAEFDAGTIVPSTSFVSGVGSPNGTINTTSNAGDCLRSTNRYTGTFATGTWTLTSRVTSTVQGGAADGQMRAKLHRSANADGSGATLIATATVVSSALNIPASPSTGDTVSQFASLASFSLNNEYLFLELAWQRLGAGGMSTTNVILTIGSAATRIVSPDFTQAVSTTASGSAVIQAADRSVTAAGNAVIQSVQSVTASGGAVIQGDRSLTASGSAVVQGEVTATSIGNAIIQAADQSLSTAGNAIIDAGVVEGSVEGSGDAVIQGEISANVSGNAIVQGEIVAIAAGSAVVQAADQSASLSGNAVVQAADQSTSFSGSAVVQAAQSADHSGDAIIQGDASSTSSGDAVIEGEVASSAVGNAVIQALDLSIGAVGNALISEGPSLVAYGDAVIQSADLSVTASGDAIVQAQQSSTASGDAIIQVERFVASSGSAVVQGEVGATAVGNAVVQIVDQSVGASGDAVITVFTISPELTLVGNAVILANQSIDLSGNAVILVSQSAGVSGNAVIIDDIPEYQHIDSQSGQSSLRDNSLGSQSALRDNSLGGQSFSSRSLRGSIKE